MRKRYLQLLIILGLFINADCSHKRGDAVYFTDEFKSYMIFDEGSFWIYENQEGERDTVVIKNVERKINSNFTMGNRYEENFYIKKHSSKYGNIKDRANQSFPCEPEGVYHSTFFDTLNINNLFYLCDDSSAMYSDRRMKFKGMVDSMIVNEETFRKVKIFEYDSINMTNYFQGKMPVPRMFYYAFNVGLIKYDDYDNNQWNLIKYNVRFSIDN